MASTWGTATWGLNNWGDQSNVTEQPTGFSLSSTLGSISMTAKLTLLHLALLLRGVKTLGPKPRGDK
jgi:hypothetical protein